MKVTSLFTLASILGCFAVGCGSADHPKTAEEEKSFKGGPMPPEFRKQFEEGQRASAASSAQNAAKAKGQAASGGQ